MREAYTPAARRSLDQTRARAADRGAELAEPLDLLLALVDEIDGRAGCMLVEHGLEPGRLFETLGARPSGEVSRDEADDEGEGEFLPTSMDLRAVLNEAAGIARQWDRGVSVGTEHLLLALLRYDPAIRERLADAGTEVESLAAAVEEHILSEIGPIPIEEEPPRLELVDPTEDLDLARIVDAASNRVREGLRVVEDYVRFVLDDPMLTRRLKDVRHRFASASRAFENELLIPARDTPNDVGAKIMTVEERARENPRSVLAANFKRIGEALRSLEEYAKLRNVWTAGQYEVLRYDVYTLEKMTMTAVRSRRALGNARLMVLVGGLPTLGDLVWTVGEALEGGADVVQLREKNLDDREWLRRAREVRILTAKAGAVFLVNDRPDIARLAGADGVHVGQTDLKPRDARRILGPAPMIGVSTHTAEQLRAAVVDGADYLGVGPVFPSGTKSFAEEELAGLRHVEHAAESTGLPWFALGGIEPGNLDSVIRAGARRIAVSGAVVRSGRPREIARALKDRLDRAAAED